MNDSPGSGVVWVPILIAAAVGPVTALVHELGVLSLGPASSLWPLLGIVVAAALGIVLGLRIGRQGLRTLNAVKYAGSAFRFGYGELGRRLARITE